MVRPKLDRRINFPVEGKMDMTKLKRGDYVQFISGGPTLVILDLYLDEKDENKEPNPEINCGWFDKLNVFRVQIFPVAALIQIE